jgi:hypothetical protein
MAAVLVYGCSSDSDDDGGATANTGAASTGASSTGGTGQGGTSSGGTASSAGGTGNVAAAGSGGSGAGMQTCINGDTQCSDCIDNDGDGFVDAFDVACVGPLDDDESSFATGIPGDNVDCKQDCFFDGDSGSGNDGCEWNIKCDPNSPGAPKCPYNPDLTPMQCGDAQSDACKNFCEQYTPNGCDCFGCCTVTLPDQMTTVNVYLGSANCTEDKLTDPTVCLTCVPTTDCANPCETCEYCLGKTELPPECSTTPDGGTGGGSNPDQCDGAPACDAATPCPPETPYCLTGCCIEIPS